MCHQIENLVNTELANEVQQLPINSEVQLHVIHMLGPRFVNEFLVNQNIHPTKFLTKDSKEYIQAREWLKEKMERIIKDLGLQRIDDSDVDDSELAPDMMEYKNFVHQVVYKGIDRELSLAENKQSNLVNNVMFLF